MRPVSGGPLTLDLEKLQRTFERDLARFERPCSYLVSRSFTSQMRAHWGLGYCRAYDEGYQQLYKRLTFPIYDWRGRLTSFAGRTLKVGYTGPKYLSLGDSGTFQKSASLYGLHFALPEIARQRVAFVVEGYTDVIGLHDLSGVVNAVGSMGVAVTEKQIALLSRWAKLVIVVLDGDAAGAKATERLMNKLSTSPVEVAYVRLPAGKDPFDLAVEQGPSFAAFLKANVTGMRSIRLNQATRM